MDAMCNEVSIKTHIIIYSFCRGFEQKMHTVKLLKLKKMLFYSR